jgi:hypothetical protein
MVAGSKGWRGRPQRRVGGPDRRSRWVGDIRRPIGGAIDDHPRRREETAASDGRNVRLARLRGPRKEPGGPQEE